MIITNKVAIADIIYGVHSNIPLCCVMEFARDVDRGIRYVAMYRHKQLNIPFKIIANENDKMWNGNSPDYVPCLDCSKKILAGLLKPVDIHRCNDCSFSYIDILNKIRHESL